MSVRSAASVAEPSGRRGRDAGERSGDREDASEVERERESLLCQVCGS